MQGRKFGQCQNANKMAVVKVQCLSPSSAANMIIYLNKNCSMFLLK